MSTPMYEALCAQRRRARADEPAVEPQTPTTIESLIAELNVCAFFADGTREGKLVPLADFTRERIAKVLRDASEFLSRPGMLPSMQPDAGVVIIAKERARQIQIEGYSPEGDRGRSRELMGAAACYLDVGLTGPGGWRHPDGRYAPPGGWPWSESSWNPSEDRTRNLAKAGALIAAAIDVTRAEA